MGDAQRGAAACRVVQQDEIKTQWQENHTKTHIDQLFSPFPDAVKLQNVPIALVVFVCGNLSVMLPRWPMRQWGQATLQNISSGGHFSDIKDSHQNVNPEDKLKK